MKINKYILSIILVLLIFSSIFISYNIGYDKGSNNGISITLDTINKICQKQLKSDTSITKLILINPDTSVYIMSRKTLLNK